MKFDHLKWVTVLLLFVCGLTANYYFGQTPAPIRVLGWILLACAILGVAALTTQGVKARQFAREARAELRKVVWPTRPETVQTTLVVVVMVILLTIIIWGMDNVLLWAIAWLTGQRG